MTGVLAALRLHSRCLGAGLAKASFEHTPSPKGGVLADAATPGAGLPPCLLRGIEPCSGFDLWAWTTTVGGADGQPKSRSRSEASATKALGWFSLAALGFCAASSSAGKGR